MCVCAAWKSKTTLFTVFIIVVAVIHYSIDRRASDCFTCVCDYVWWFECGLHLWQITPSMCISSGNERKEEKKSRQTDEHTHTAAAMRFQWVSEWMNVCVRAQPHSIICDCLYYLLLARIPEIISTLDKISYSRPTRRIHERVEKSTKQWHSISRFLFIFLCILCFDLLCAVCELNARESSSWLCRSCVSWIEKN